MRTYCLLISLFIIIPFDVRAQISKDTIFSNIKKEIEVKKLLTFGKEGFVKIKSDNFEEPSIFEMESYNLNNELIDKQSLSTNRGNEWFAIEGTFVWDTTLVVLASLYHPGPQRNHLLVYQYSLPKLELINAKILLDCFAPVETRIPFLYKLSPDKSKLIIAAWSLREEKENAKIDLFIYNSDFRQLANFQKILPFKNRRFFPEEVLIDDNGNCYYVVNNYTGNLAYEYLNPMSMKKYVLTYSVDSKQDTIYQFPENKINYESTRFIINQQQELIGVTLGKKKNRLIIDGITFTKLIPTTKEFITQHNIIDKSQFKQAFSVYNPNFETPKYSFIDYSLKQVVAIDNSYYLLGDRYVETGYRHDSENKFDVAKIQTVFELQDIFIIKLEANGSIRWMNRIPKKQEGMNIFFPFLSFKAFARKNHLLVLYNDSYENIAATTKRAMTKSTVKDANLVINQVDLNNGQFKVRRLQNLLGQKYLAQTNYIQRISDNELFFYANGREVGVKNSIVKILKLKAE